MTTKSFDFNLAGYHVIEEIVRNPKTIVYRALVDGLELESDRHTVIIKLLSSAYPTYQEFVNFYNQYTISKNIELPGVVRLYSLEEYHTLSQRGYALVMEDFGGVSLDMYAGESSLPVAAVLNIAVQLADTLHEIGQQRIIHKDIKPSNILINPTTKQVKLIDFGIAALLPRETSEMFNSQSLEGTLAYMSPEQTGRMNRGIDDRTDFYALGVTLYKLLTGRLPFETENSIELVHCHLAQIAIPVHRVNPDVSPVVSQIIAKLMAKNVEDRYQSALGIKYDLNECLRQFEQTGTISEFKIGQRDLSNRFIIPDRLYGRESEIEMLLNAFTRVSQGQTELILIAGSSGTGKTALINEIHKPIVKKCGYFIKGKYDQFNRDIPFSGLIQAFRDLIGQLFGESDTELANWKSKILAAVGKNGGVLLEVIPELIQIIGSQPPVIKLLGMGEQNRFNLLLRQFLGVFATASHPLTIFLDDLQWADSASLKSIELLLSGTEYVLLLGSYRDNEVSQFDLLMLMLQQLEKTDAIVKTIFLDPLAIENTNRLVADTLHCDLDTAKPLTKSIDLKTKGNPFFTIQFLKALHSDGELTFNPEGYWECDLVRIQSLTIGNDVVKFMAEQLQKLSNKTQQVIKLAACIGSKFDLDTLAIIAEQSQVNITMALWEGLQAGLILPTIQIYKFDSTKPKLREKDFKIDGIELSVPNHPEFPTQTLPLLTFDFQLLTENHTYRFLHDRIQQAAYSLIPEGQKRSTHLQIARLLSVNTPNIEESDRLLEIVNHFNLATHLQQEIAIDLIDEPAECQRLAQLNLRAAQKARASTAYGSAFNYARIGIEIIGSIGWKTAYQLTLNLHEMLAETAFLNGDLEIVMELVQVVLDRVQNTLDRVKTYETIVRFHILKKEYRSAIDRGLEILQQLGIKLSPEPSKLVLASELLKTKIALLGKSSEQLLAIPDLLDTAKEAPLKILELLQTPAFFADQELMVILATTGIQQTLQHGNNRWAASFYGTYALILSSLEQLKESYQIGQMVNVLIDRFDELAITAKIKATSPWMLQLWQEDFRAGIPIVDESIVVAMESGNLTFLGIGAYTSILIRLFAGVSLDEIIDRMPEIERIVAYSKDESSLQLLSISRQKINNLRQTSSTPFTLLATEYDEWMAISNWKQDNEVTLLSTIYGAKAQLAYIFEDMSAALEYTNAWILYPMTGIAKASIFDALSRLANYSHSDKKVKQQLLQQVNITQSQLAKRAKLMPGNFQHKYDLVTAEKCRVLGDFTTAIELYDRAIAGARANKYLHEEAISNECAARFYYAWGKAQIAAAYMQSAYYCYARWGAKAKTDDLERRYPEFLRE
jgi:predicted ATPase